MIREYEDKRIYKNLKTVKILSAISLVLSLVVVVSAVLNYVFAKRIQFPQNVTNDSGGIELVVLFCVYVAFYPFTLQMFCIDSLKQTKVKTPIYCKKVKIPIYSKDDFLKKECREKEKVKWRKTRIVQESKNFNDFINMLSTAIFMPAIFIIGVLIGALGFYGIGGFAVWAFLLGSVCVPHLLGAPSIILLRNCVLIKREWKKNPPQWYAQAKSEKEAQKQMDKEKQQQAESDRLLGLVGKRFFVELYTQLRDWDELDILDKIRSEYGEETAKKRISHGKEIFQKGLEQFALQSICALPDEKIDGETKGKAEDLMQKFTKEKGEND